MPFYDFRCGCGNEFNVMARIADIERRSIKCPKCGSADLSRVYGNINVIAAPAKTNAPACPNEHICGARCRH